MLLTSVSALTVAWHLVAPGGLLAEAPGRQAQTALPQAQESSALGPPSADTSAGDHGVDGEFLFNYYDQDGEHSAVTGGIGTEDLQVLAPLVIANWTINDRWSLNASFGLDQITSASTDNIVIDDVTGASLIDLRTFSTIEVARTFETQTVGVSGGFSNEWDYRSLMAGFRWTRDFNLRNTTVTANGRYYSDRLLLIGINGSGLDQKGGPHHPGWGRRCSCQARRQTADLSLSLTQLLGRRTVGTVEAGLTIQRGFLSTPYQEVILAGSHGEPNGRRVAERLPDTRDRRAVGARLNHAVTDGLVERFGYRYYNDTFGITAHTIDSETHVRLPSDDEMWVFPILRYHRQTGSDYFGLPGTQTIDREFFTADWDLSTFDSWRYGGGWKWIGAGGGRLSALPFRSVEARFTVYDRSDGLRAYAVGLGWGF